MNAVLGHETNTALFVICYFCVVCFLLLRYMRAWLCPGRRGECVPKNHRLNRKSIQEMIAQGRQAAPGGATDRFLKRLNRKSIPKMIAQGRQAAPGGATDRFLIRLNRKSIPKMIAQGRQAALGGATDRFLIRLNVKSIQK